MNAIFCYFKGHDWKGVSWNKTGTTVDWAMNVVPEYTREEVFSNCGSKRKEKYISLADKVIR